MPGAVTNTSHTLSSNFHDCFLEEADGCFVDGETEARIKAKSVFCHVGSTVSLN